MRHYCIRMLVKKDIKHNTSYSKAITLFPLAAVLLVSLNACSAMPEPIVGSLSEDVSELQSEEAVVQQSAREEAVPEMVDEALLLQTKALAVLNQKCLACHNPSNPVGGYDSAGDIQRMIDSGVFLVPGRPDLSRVYASLAPDGNMPPSGDISEEERKILYDWIISLADKPRDPLSDAMALNLIRKDLENNVSPESRQSVRYLSLQNLYNRGFSDNKLATVHLAIRKLINSLTFAKNLIMPVALDENGVLLRINLDELEINRNRFNSIMNDYYPFSVNFVVANNSQSSTLADDHNFIRQMTGTTNYLIRADWFVATAALPELYRRFLNLPNRVRDLESRIGINALRNIRDNSVARSGFKRSNVSSQNRVIERHVSSTTGLAYWVSYDFKEETGRQNIFNNPLGPSGIGFENRSFEPEGGEFIIQLPNGLFAYYLANGQGDSIDRGPLSVVRQEGGPKQLQGHIVNGMSCFTCHGRGILPQDDQIRSFAASSTAFRQEEKQKIDRLYVDKVVMRQLIEADNQTYFAALKKLGIDPFQPEVAALAFSFYHQELSREDVMQELQINETQMMELLERQPFNSRWVALRSADGRVSREEFNIFFQRAMRLSHGHIREVIPRSGDYIPSPSCMNTNDLFMNTCISDIAR